MLKLKRIALLPTATFGVLLWNDVPFAVTTERAWLLNKKGISCIPTGEYVCKRFKSAKHPNTFEVTNVPDRTAILFHTGNTAGDSQGCIIIGEQFGVINGKAGILVSKAGFGEFLEKTTGLDTFNFEIV